jgi:hypothetical protein
MKKKRKKKKEEKRGKINKKDQSQVIFNLLRTKT